MALIGRDRRAPGLTAAQKAFYDKQGYVLVPGLFTAEEAAAAKQQTWYDGKGPGKDPAPSFFKYFKRSRRSAEAPAAPMEPVQVFEGETVEAPAP